MSDALSDLQADLEAIPEEKRAQARAALREQLGPLMQSWDDEERQRRAARIEAIREPAERLKQRLARFAEVMDEASGLFVEIEAAVANLRGLLPASAGRGLPRLVPASVNLPAFDADAAARAVDVAVGRAVDLIETQDAA